MFPSVGQFSLGFVITFSQLASVLDSEYSFKRSTATMFVSTSEVILIKQFRVAVTAKAYDIDNPIKPGVRLSLPSTANKAAQKMIRFPKVSKRIASHLFDTKEGKFAFSKQNN